jgi:twitching motility protein PilT
MNKRGMIALEALVASAQILLLAAVVCGLLVTFWQTWLACNQASRQRQWSTVAFAYLDQDLRDADRVVKSTTMASLINEINRTRACHILTLEDPIEYVHQHEKSIVNQREIGQDSKSFANALRAALRQDPDVILVGEMRDLETISTAVTAAETGHLVLATLHTSGAPAAVDRIIDAFPAHQQQQIRVQLADTLRGIVAQRLLPRKGQKGRVMACEILVGNSAVKNLIREGKLHQIPTTMETGSKFGMQTFEQSLKLLVDQGLIEPVQL